MSPFWRPRRERDKEQPELGASCGASPEGKRLTLVLGDHNAEVLDALRGAFATAATARIVDGDLLRERVDAIISPGNSFGDMGGGFDRALDEYFKSRAQAAAQAAIATHALGELPVGAALVLRITPARPYLVVAPTMRVPGPVRRHAQCVLGAASGARRDPSAQRGVRSRRADRYRRCHCSLHGRRSHASRRISPPDARRLRFDHPRALAARCASRPSTVRHAE